MDANHTLAEYRRAVEDFLTEWDALTGFQTSKADLAPRLRIVAGLCADVHEQARTALVLWDSKMVFQSAPLVRVAFESAMRAAWTAEYGADEFLADAERSSYLHLQQAKRSLPRLSPAAQEMLDEFASSEETRRKATSMEALCRKIHEGDGLYLIYRMLSGQCHPGWPIVGRHMEQRDGVLGLRKRPTDAEIDGFWAWVMVASLLWANRALDDIDEGNPRRRALRRVAQHFDVVKINFKR